jgi:hypothetical protein
MAGRRLSRRSKSSSRRSFMARRQHAMISAWAALSAATIRRSSSSAAMPAAEPGELVRTAMCVPQLETLPCANSPTGLAATHEKNGEGEIHRAPCHLSAASRSIDGFR